MRKLMSLIKACMTDNMSLFKIRKKDKTKNNGKNITIMYISIISPNINSRESTFNAIYSHNSNFNTGRRNL